MIALKSLTGKCPSTGRNPLTAHEAKSVFAETRYMSAMTRLPGAPYRQFTLGRIAGKANVVGGYGRGRGVKDRAWQIERAASRLAHSGSKSRVAMNRSRKNAPNLSTSRHAAARGNRRGGAQVPRAHGSSQSRPLARRDDVGHHDEGEGFLGAEGVRRVGERQVLLFVTPSTGCGVPPEEGDRGSSSIAAGSWG
jgi:hypothetical protein